MHAGFRLTFPYLHTGELLMIFSETSNTDAAVYVLINKSKSLHVLNVIS